MATTLTSIKVNCPCCRQPIDMDIEMTGEPTRSAPASTWSKVHVAAEQPRFSEHVRAVMRRFEIAGSFE